MFRLAKCIPTVEFEPHDWCSRDYSPEIGMEQWPALWASELAKRNLAPLYPGAWYVPVSQLESPELLDELLQKQLSGAGIAGFPDDEGEHAEDSERIGALSGGFALYSEGGKPIVEPSCCCDLSDLAFWEACAQLGPGESVGFYIGHGNISASRQRDHLRLRDTPERVGAEVRDLSVEMLSLSKPLADARAMVASLWKRLEVRLAHLVGAERTVELAGLLTGLGR